MAAPAQAPGTGGKEDAAGAAACAARYNSGLRTLSRILVAAAPEDPLIRRSQRQVSLVLEILPFLAINLTGPYLLKYQREVYALEAGTEEGDAFFLNNSFDDDLGESADEERQRDTAEVIPQVKKAALALPSEERWVIRRTVVELLDTYLDYVVARGGAES